MDLETKQKGLEELIKSKDAQIQDLSDKLKELETVVRSVKEDTEKLKEAQDRKNETEDEVSKTLKELDLKISRNHASVFRSFSEFRMLTSTNISKLSVKLEPVLQELGFIKPCIKCWKVFKTERQLRHHMKEEHIEEDD